MNVFRNRVAMKSVKSVFGTLPIVLLSFGLLVGGLAPVRAGAPPLSGKRVLFLGDSITQNGQYVSFIEYYLDKRYPARTFDFISIGLASETVSGLSEKAHPFPRPYLHNRLQNALRAIKPSIVVACYGMNDGIYHPESPDRKAAFEKGIKTLIAKVHAAGATLILLTPPPFDPIPVRSAARPAGAPDYSFMNPYSHYDDVLKDYAAWEMTLPKSDAQVIDLHTPVAAYLAAQRKHDPGYQFSPDGIHPPPVGHLIMAHVILGALGVPTYTGSPTTELAKVTGDPLYTEVAALREERSEGWLSYVGYTRGATVKTDSVASTESDVSGMQRDIDQLRRGTVVASKPVPQSIKWGAPIHIASVNQIDTNGAVVQAGRWGGKTVVVHVGAKAIVFAKRPVTPSGHTVEIAATSGAGTYNGAFSGNTGSPELNAVLDCFAYDGPNPRVLELHGLKIGHSYEVQVFALDDRDLVKADHRPGTRVVRLGDRPDFKGGNSKPFRMKDNAAVIGRFTATASAVDIYEDEMNPLDHSGNINAYVLCDVTPK
jgi:lysophospholipase L1-like esterase